MPPADHAAWARLGALLAEYRIQQGYGDLTAFAAAHGGKIKWRTFWDLEKARRDTFRPATIRQFEDAYGLVPGSLDRTLAGGGLEPLPAAAPVPDPLPAPASEPQGDAAWDLFPDDALKRYLWRAPMDENERAKVIRWLDGERAKSGFPDREADAGLPHPPHRGM